MRQHRIVTDTVVSKLRQSITKLYGLQSCYIAQGSHWNDICEDETGVQGMEVERGIKENLEKQE